MKLLSACLAGLAVASPAFAQIPANDDCATPEALTSVGVFPLDSTSATTSIVNAMGCTAAPTSRHDVWFSWQPFKTADFVFSTLDSALYGFDTTLAIYDNSLCDGSGCVAFNDDALGLGLGSQVVLSATLGTTYLIQVSSPTTVGLNVLSIEWTPLGAITTFCDPSQPSMNGEPVQLRGTGANPIGTGLLLNGFNGPAGEFGYLLVSQGMLDPGTPIGGGNFCLGNGSQLYRYNVNGSVHNSIGSFDSVGVFNNLVGTGNPAGYGYSVPVPLPDGNAITQGSTWHFQLWCRDGNSSNFSNGVTANF